MTSPQRSLAVAHLVCRRAAAADLAGRPFYAVQPPRGWARSSLGLSAPELCDTFRPQLIASGEWRGEGIAVLVDAVAIFELSADPFTAERHAVGICLHEIAHEIDRHDDDQEPDQGPEPSPACQPVKPTADRLPQLWHTVTASQDQDREALQIAPAFWSHGETFTRICCHLWYRAVHVAGYRLSPRCLAFANAYLSLEALASPEEYVATLADECKRHAGRPLAELRDIEPPETFSRLWHADVERVFSAGEAARLAVA